MSEHSFQDQMNARIREMVEQIALETGVPVEAVVPRALAGLARAQTQAAELSAQGIVPFFTRKEFEEGIEICPGVRLIPQK